jgi:hypothetical protein
MNPYQVAIGPTLFNLHSTRIQRLVRRECSFRLASLSGLLLFLVYQAYIRVRACRVKRDQIYVSKLEADL